MRQFMGLVRAVLTLGACIAPCWGQSSSITVGSSDGLTPPALEPGTPSGSYALSDFDTVNLFNGKLSVAVPLVRVGAQSARTEAGYTMTWVADRSWNVSENQYCAPDQHGDTRCYWGTEVNDGGWSWQAAPGLSPGTMWARSSGDTLNFCFFPVTNSTYYYADNTSTRLTFTRPDGTETEFVDTASHGQPQRHDYACGPGAWAGQNRGRTFVATDGSGARFTSMQDIVDVGPGFANSDYPVCGRLQFADGTTYTFGHPETCSDTTFTDNGLATSILDRNGNLFSFLYDSQRRLYQATDPLGRQTSISYASVIPSENTWIKITDPSNRVTTLNFESLENVLRSGYSVQTPEQLFPTLTPPFTLIHYELFLSSIIYPNNSTMTFRYNPYGEVARIGLPTGGAFEYDWDGTLVQLPSESPDMTGFMVYRRVQERRVYNTGDILEQVQRYAASETCSSAGIQPGYPQQCSTTVIVSYKNGQNADLGSETHTYSGSASCGPYPNCSVNGTPPQEVQWLKFFTPWKTGRENQTVFADTSGGSLKTEQAQWQQRGCTEGGCWFSDVNSDIAPAHDARMIQTVTSLGSATSSQVYCYDGNNNRTDVYEYDYGYSGGMVSYCQPPSGWVRRTHTDFNTTYAALNMLRLPSSQQVSTPQGTVSRTQYSYDDYGELPLTPYSSPAQHDSTFGASYTSRGNLTKVSKWLDTTSEYLADKTKYDILGNVVARTNPKSYSTTYSFNGMCGYGFPTSISNALNHTASLVYDCGLGKATQFTDANGVVTKYTYEPGLLGRLKQVDRGYSKPERITSVYNYNDTAGSVAVETSVDVQTSGDGQNVSTVFYDGLGRESESRQNVDTNTCSSGGYVSVQRQYDGRGRLWKVSNPACGSNPQDWTVTAYDGLGRPTDITAPGAAVTHTDYGGAVATTRDPANTTRAVTTDALGRITRVVENGTYTTSYSYNVLDNLTCVSQSGQYRVFDYDSLGRLTSADNPETRVQAINSCSPGSPAARPTVKFTYDTAGNLLTRTDSAGSVTSYAPDALDRVVSKTTAEGTVQFTFDQNLAITEENDTNYPIGRLTGVSFGTLGSTYRYDALGRYQSSQQTVDALPAFIFHYDWVPAGLAAMKYPSGRVVSTSYDSAGRPSGVTGYASAVQYAPHGVLSGMTFANGLSERWTFNRRTQPGCLVALVGSTAVLKLTNSFSSSGADPCNAGTSPGSDNNGNVRAQSVVVGTTTFTQSYGYDGLNRSARPWRPTEGWGGRRGLAMTPGGTGARHRRWEPRCGRRRDTVARATGSAGRGGVTPMGRGTAARGT
jgi:YD repeat-containing protein